MVLIGRRQRLTAAVVCISIMCVTLTSCFVYNENYDNEIIGGDWHVWRSYSNDYVLSDDITVCFSTLDTGNGYAVYDSSYGGRIGNLMLPGLSIDDVGDNGFEIEDYDGDGIKDVGIITDDGSVIRYLYVSGAEAWPENIEGCFTCIDTNVSSSSVSYPFEPYAIEKLNEEQKKLYDEIYPLIISMEDFSYEAAVYGYDILDDLFTVWNALKTDYPEINNYFMIWENIGDEGETISLDSHYYCVWEDEESNDKEKIREGLKVFEQECDEIIASLPKDASTYEKYRYIAMEVSKRIQYDYEFEHPDRAAPYGIITGYAICQGYAEIYQYLCAKADLWCRVVEGSSQNTSHAWNLVKLESGTYHIDITWADEQGEPGYSEWMRYFMLTQEKILTDHEISDGTEASGK